MSVLYLSTPGLTLAAASEALVVRQGRSLVQKVPVLGLERLLVLRPAHLTSAALALCARRQVEVVVIAAGRPLSMLRLGASGSGVALRIAQHRRADDLAYCLGFAREIVRGKVRNQRRLLGRTRAATEPTVAASRAALAHARSAVDSVGSVAAMRGVEGRASAAYFRALRTLVNPEFGFRSRNRRPPRDAANALLSYLYTLLTAECVAALCAAALEPAVGLFHRARAGRPALALDLVEEFRAPAADAVLLQLTGRRIVSPADFHLGAAGAQMRPAARRRVIEAYEAKLSAPFRDRSGTDTTLRASLRAQAIRLAAALREGGPYRAFELP